MPYLDEEFQNKIKTLPQDLQQAIWSLDVYQKMLDIRDRHNLLINEGGYLYDEVKKVLVGEEKAADFFANIGAKLEDVEKEIVTEVAADVDKEIFMPIKEHLMKIEGMKSATLKQADTEEEHLRLRKDDILSGIETPTPSSFLSQKARIEREERYNPIVLPRQSSGLMSASEKLRNVGLEDVTESRRMEELRKERLEEAATPAKTGLPFPPEIKANPPSLVDAKLTQIVRSPKEEIVVKSSLQKPKTTDPYREATN